MKKLAASILFVVLFSISVEAQKDVAFAYARYTLTHIIDTTQPDNPLIQKSILSLGKNMSSYGIDRSASSSAITTFSSPSGGQLSVGNVPASGRIVVDNVAGPSPNFSAFNVLGYYFKDMNGSKLLNVKIAGSQLFAVEENMPEINWNITQDTKEIMGLQCQKATCDFRGRTYEAWFSSQLPYSNGPWKLGGLPGLIIEASDTKKEVVFKFVSFENAPAGEEKAIEIPASVLKTTPKEFKGYQDAIDRDREAGISNNKSAGGGLVVVSGGMRAGAVGPDGKPLKMRGNNNPIEKETPKN